MTRRRAEWIRGFAAAARQDPGIPDANARPGQFAPGLDDGTRIWNGDHAERAGSTPRAGREARTGAALLSSHDVKVFDGPTERSLRPARSDPALSVRSPSKIRVPSFSSFKGSESLKISTTLTP